MREMFVVDLWSFGGCVDRTLEKDGGPLAYLRPYLEGSAECGRPLLHAQQPEGPRGLTVAHCEALPIVPHFQTEHLVGHIEREHDTSSPRVPGGVGKGFLGDPVDGEFDLFTEMWDRSPTFRQHPRSVRRHSACEHPQRAFEPEIAEQHRLQIPRE